MSKQILPQSEYTTQINELQKRIAEFRNMPLRKMAIKLLGPEYNFKKKDVASILEVSYETLNKLLKGGKQ